MNCKEEDGHSGWLCVEVVSGPRETMDESSCVPENKESTSLSGDIYPQPPLRRRRHYCTPTFQRTASGQAYASGPRPALLAFTCSYHYVLLKRGVASSLAFVVVYLQHYGRIRAQM